MRRRTFLAVAGVAAGLPGCVADGAPGTGIETRTVDGPVRKNQELSGGLVRCRGKPVSTERPILDEPGYGDDIRYFPSNETFRIVVARASHDDPGWFETVPFEEWASIECGEAAARRARNATATRLGVDRFGSGVGKRPDSPRSDSIVSLTVSKGEGKNEAERTAALFSRLVRLAPQSVEATVSIDGDSYTRTVAVFAEPRNEAVAL